MMKFINISILIMLLTSCIPPGEAFIVNRSGNDVVVYTKDIGRILYNGCDEVHHPLRSSYFTLERLRIKKCPGELYEKWKCPEIPEKDFGNVAEKIDALHAYQDKIGKRAAYLLDENFNLILIPYDEKFKKRQLKNGKFICE